MIASLGRNDFCRLRVGVGRPQEGSDVTGHVLGRFASSESRLLDDIIARAEEALITIIRKGVREGMNQFNRK